MPKNYTQLSFILMFQIEALKKAGMTEKLIADNMEFTLPSFAESCTEIGLSEIVLEGGLLLASNAQLSSLTALPRQALVGGVY